MHVLGEASLGFHFQDLLPVAMKVRCLRKPLSLLPCDSPAHAQDKGPAFGQQRG